eukprot:748014-Hanusia_phi.AAC.2
MQSRIVSKLPSGSLPSSTLPTRFKIARIARAFCMVFASSHASCSSYRTSTKPPSTRLCLAASHREMQLIAPTATERTLLGPDTMEAFSACSSPSQLTILGHTSSQKAAQLLRTSAASSFIRLCPVDRSSTKFSSAPSVSTMASAFSSLPKASSPRALHE